jgi:hypothetical protein
MLNTKQRRQEKENHWRPHLEAWQKSQQTMIAYCREQQLNVEQFRYWNTQLCKTQQTAPLSFSEMKVNWLSSNATIPSLDMLLSNGHCLKIPLNYDDKTLSRLFHLLGVVP